MNLADKIVKANKYKFFSTCFYYPEEPQTRSVDTIGKSLPGALPENLNVNGDLSRIQVDYARLFLGPFKVLAPPYESVYLDDGRQVFGESTVDVRQYYRAENLNVGINEPPDHIAIELEFMYYLLCKEIEALKNENAEEAEKYRLKQKQFFSLHLSKWVESFTRCVIEHAKCDYYKDLAWSLQSEIKKDVLEFNLNGN